MENNIFSFGRFGRYFSYDVKRWVASYGPTFLLYCLIPVICYTTVLLMSLIFGNGWHTPGLIARWSVLGVTAFLLLLTYPFQVYGFVTDKRAGSDFLMIPVSVTEKFVSMFLNVAVVVPAIFMILYLSVDALLCALDPTCGASLVSSFSDAMSMITNFGEIESPIKIGWFGVYSSFLQNILYFLLGALVFKKHKVLYPILIMIGLQMLLTTVFGALFANFGFGSDFIERFVERYMSDPDGLANSIVWFNVIGSVITFIINAALAVGIWFRLRTIKH